MTRRTSRPPIIFPIELSTRNRFKGVTPTTTSASFRNQQAVVQPAVYRNNNNNNVRYTGKHRRCGLFVFVDFSSLHVILSVMYVAYFCTPGADVGYLCSPCSFRSARYGRWCAGVHVVLGKRREKRNVKKIHETSRGKNSFYTDNARE